MSDASKRGFVAVLAGGRGVRMHTDQPKVLLPVGGISMLERVVRSARKAAVGDIVCILGYSAEKVASVVRGYNVQLETREPLLGPVHALTALDAYLDQREIDHVIVFPADVPLLSAETLVRLRDRHVASDAVMTLVTAVATR